MNAAPSTVAIVTPFYQKTPGILRRALESVLDQTLRDDIRLMVVIVDDGSPSPVEPELETLSFPPNIGCEVIRQANGGCAAARNAGLNHIGADIGYVTFLDSDDYWKPDHIVTALDTLALGYDFYFTDHDRIGHHASHFAAIDFPQALAATGSASRIGDHLWSVEKSAFYKFFVRVFTAHISTVMIRWHLVCDIRFNNNLRTAGEDYIYMLQALARCTTICFSDKIMSTCGDGINIYYATYSWEDEGHLRRLMGDILSLYAFKRLPELGPEERSYTAQKLKMLKYRFSYFLARWLVKQRGKLSADLRRLMKADDTLQRWLPITIAKVTILKALGRYSPLTDFETSG
jgi:succinoglycan biosynthesis protein ExoW